jgi:phenylpyruvate tautomerase PptA (4-oxalocrotonate tautomerase family)
MPVSYIDIPSGVSQSAQARLFTEVFEAMHEAWPIPDTRVLIREWPAASVSQDGQIDDTPMRPICSFEAPELPIDAKRKLVHRISTTIAEACGRTEEEVVLPSGTRVQTNWVLTFFREYPLDQAALGDLLALENPMVLEMAPQHD